MSKKTERKALSLLLGAAVVASLGTAGIANAGVSAENPFSMEVLTSGYLTAGAHETEKKGEEGSCGDDKGEEGSCGDDKKEGEGKCGEGKCGSA